MRFLRFSFVSFFLCVLMPSYDSFDSGREHKIIIVHDSLYTHTHTHTTLKSCQSDKIASNRVDGDLLVHNKGIASTTLKEKKTGGSFENLLSSWKRAMISIARARKLFTETNSKRECEQVFWKDGPTMILQLLLGIHILHLMNKQSGKTLLNIPFVILYLFLVEGKSLFGSTFHTFLVKFN